MRAVRRTGSHYAAQARGECAIGRAGEEPLRGDAGDAVGVELSALGGGAVPQGGAGDWVHRRYDAPDRFGCIVEG
jgi:hypothetical protein